jgi:O-antigen/teichoic acid export membrane protein
MTDLDRSSVALYLARSLISAIGFVSTIYFARELGAGGLGIYFTVETVVTVLAVFSRFGVDNAVVKRLSGADSDNQRSSYLTGAFLLVTAPFAVVSLGVGLAGGPLQRLLEVAAAPLVVLLLAGETAQWMLVSALRGERRITTSAGVELLGEVARVVVSVALVVAGYGALGLVYGLFAGQALRAVTAMGLLDTGFAWPSRTILGDLVDFSKYTAGMNVSHLAYSWLDTLLLALLVSKSAVGVYEAAWKVSAVVMLASSSIGASLAPTVSRWHADGETEQIVDAFEEAVTYALLLVVPAVVGVALVGDQFMQVVYEFDRGGTVLLVLVAGMLFQAVKDIVQSTLLGTERQRAVFWTNVVSLTANGLLTLLLIPRYGMVGAAVATSLTAGVAAVLQLGYLRQHLAIGVETGALVWQVGAATLMGGLVYGLSRVVADGPLALVVLVATGGAIYGTLVLGHTGMRTRLLGVIDA